MMSLSTNAHNSMVVSQFFIQQWPNFMLPVTSVVLVGCIENASIPPQHGKEQHDVMTLYFFETDPELPGMRGMTIGHVFLFFSFMFQDVHFPCALIHLYPTDGTEPDEDTGLWGVLYCAPPFPGGIAGIWAESRRLVGIWWEYFLGESPPKFHLDWE